MTKSSRSFKSIISKFSGAIFALVITLILFLNLGRDSLIDWDEGIYAQLGVEMLENGSYLTPSWNQEVWLEKPPGIAWISAMGITLMGNTELGARLFMPIFTGMTIYLIYLIGVKLKSSRLGLISASLLTHFTLFLDRGKVLNADGPLLTLITLSIYLSLINSPAVLIAIIVFFAIWIKGLAGLLALALIAPIFRRNYRKFAHISLFSFLFAIPWHLYQLAINGDTFINPYFKEQVLRRITTPIEFHFESKWFYFNQLYIDLGLGIIVILLIGIAILLRTYNLKKSKINYSELLLFWIGFPIFIFTLAKTRLYWYILPVYPAIALIISNLFETLATSKTSQRVLNFLTIGFMLNSILFAYQSYDPTRTISHIPPKIQLIKDVRSFNTSLTILVSENERIAEAILPKQQRLSSSFRYGGMPSVVYYYGNKVNFYYNTAYFKDLLDSSQSPLTLIHEPDLRFVPEGYTMYAKEDDNLIITKEN